MHPTYIQIAVGIGIAVTSGLGAIIGYLLKDIRTSVKEQQTDQKDAIEKVKGDLANFKTQVAHQYVHKDDYIRTIASFDKKMDDVAKEISDLNKNVSELLGKEAK